MNADCFWFSFLIGIEKNAVTRLMATCHVLAATLICSKTDTRSVTAVAVSATSWLSLQSSTVILQDPSSFFSGQTGELNEDMMGATTSVSFGL